MGKTYHIQFFSIHLLEIDYWCLKQQDIDNDINQLKEKHNQALNSEIYSEI